jgi:ubiquinone/menaquinone biosynthesis C-methylase UbiE
MADAEDRAFHAFERDGWASNSSEAYDRVFGPITGRVIDALLDAAGVAQGTRLLDVATGPGYVAARAAARGAKATGVDFSPQMLALARRANPAIDFVEGDAEVLAFDAGAFDAVVANFCLLHLARPDRAAGEFARVLAPGGRVAMTVWGPPDRARVLGVFPEAMRAASAPVPAQIPAGPDFFRFASDHEFARLLDRAGFADPQVRTIDFTHRIPDAAHLWDGILDGTVRTRALLRLQSDAVRDRIRAEFERLLAPHRVRDGFDVPVCVKLASATKP